MKKKKKKKGNTPKRKRMNRLARFRSANTWIGSYSGKNIVKTYSKWFGVDYLCAIKELRMLDVHISQEYEHKVKQSIEENLKHRRKKKQLEANKIKGPQEFEANGNFAFIAGFTSNGVPFGVTYEKLASEEIFKEIETEDIFANKEDKKLMSGSTNRLADPAVISMFQ